jgi:hypothetical protein
MLVDITNRPTIVKPKDSGSYEVLTKALSVLGSIRFDKDCRIIDSALDELVASGVALNKFVFTKAGFLVGHQAATPHRDVEHIWTSAEMVFPTHLLTGRALDHANELQLKFVGGLVRFRISLRDETWLVFRRESGMYNKYTGKEITISEYWINEAFVMPEKQKATSFAISDLQRKFNSELRA